MVLPTGAQNSFPPTFLEAGSRSGWHTDGFEATSSPSTLTPLGGQVLEELVWGDQGGPGCRAPTGKAG